MMRKIAAFCFMLGLFGCAAIGSYQPDAARTAADQVIDDLWPVAKKTAPRATTTPEPRT